MSPQLSSTTTTTTTKVRVTVTDLPAVQRVLVMLTGRAYVLTHFEAEEAGGGRWRISVDLVADAPDEVALLEARLHRVTSVLLVDVRMGGALAATA